MAEKNIIFSVSDTHNAVVRLKYAVYMAKMLGAKLFGVMVIDEKSIQELIAGKLFSDEEAARLEMEQAEHTKMFFERAKIMAQNKGVVFEGFIQKGSVHDKIVNFAKEKNSMMIIIGEIKDILSRKDMFYHTGERIVRLSPCPVLIVRNQEMVERLYNEI